MVSNFVTMSNSIMLANTYLCRTIFWKFILMCVPLIGYFFDSFYLDSILCTSEGGNRSKWAVVVFVGKEIK